VNPEHHLAEPELIATIAPPYARPLADLADRSTVNALLSQLGAAQSGARSSQRRTKPPHRSAIWFLLLLTGPTRPPRKTVTENLNPDPNNELLNECDLITWTTIRRHLWQKHLARVT
jgi:hypothetical protein